MIPLVISLGPSLQIILSLAIECIEFIALVKHTILIRLVFVRLVFVRLVFVRLVAKAN
jgi:hypothetical protein